MMGQPPSSQGAEWEAEDSYQTSHLWGITVAVSARLYSAEPAKGITGLPTSKPI